ncbi:MAG: efflux RND transporter periplasmic adaptor subunit [Acidobacteriia bacterium]|nr:efflux RND transporter periplasmic adaptor subunit [Terriglobia bacterium]
MALTDKKPGWFSRHWLVWTIGIVVAVVVLASFVSRDDVVRVRAATVQRGTIRSAVSTNGKVEPLQSFEAHAPAGTTVRRVLVKEGDHVARGQLLVQMDDADARNQAARALSQMKAAQAEVSAVESGGTHEEVLTLEAQLVKARSDHDAAQRNLEALQKLLQTGAASPGEVKDAQNQLATTEANLELLEQKQKGRYSPPEVARVEAQKEEAQAAYSAAQDVLSQLNIRSPFAGVVYSLPVREGNYLNAGDLVVQVADLSKVQIRAFVDEPDVGRLAAGQKIEVTWDAVPGRVWQGSLNGVPATVKLRGARNVGETTCVVDNHDFKLLPNVNVTVMIVIAEHQNTLTVPREAIRLDGTKPFVLQIVNNELHRRDVQTSVSDLTTVEITGGIAESSQVALNSPDSKPLHDGLVVKVVR